MMWKIYLLGVLGNLSAFFQVATILLAVLLFSFLMVWLNGDCGEQMSKWVKRTIIAFFICIMGCMFTPTEKQLYAIVGIGGTLEYLQSNEKAKQLPDKVIDAVYKYLDDNKGSEHE